MSNLTTLPCKALVDGIIIAASNPRDHEGEERALALGMEGVLRIGRKNLLTVAEWIWVFERLRSAVPHVEVRSRDGVVTEIRADPKKSAKSPRVVKRVRVFRERLLGLLPHETIPHSSAKEV